MCDSGGMSGVGTIAQGMLAVARPALGRVKTSYSVAGVAGVRVAPPRGEQILVGAFQPNANR